LLFSLLAADPAEIGLLRQIDPKHRPQFRGG
jgi:hypothetical protein